MSKAPLCTIPEFADGSNFAELFRRFTRRRDPAGSGATEAGGSEDHDLYLVRNNVWPLLLEALDGLARKIEFQAERGRLREFNCMGWLGSYLLRNHPRRAVVRDGQRRLCFDAMRELAALEQGRRELYDRFYHRFYHRSTRKEEMRAKSARKESLPRMNDIFRTGRRPEVEGGLVPLSTRPLLHEHCSSQA